MPYNNLLYFLIVIFVFSTDAASASPGIPPLGAGMLFFLLSYLFSRFSRRSFARTVSGAVPYTAVERRLTLLAVLLFVCFVYGLDLKYYLKPFDLHSRLPILADCAGMGVFFFLLILIWKNARPHYERIFRCRYTPFGFIWANTRINLPIILPWLALSFIFDLLNALSLPAINRLLRPPWGDLLLFCLFLVFLLFVFPPLIRNVWGCTPLPPGPVRNRLEAFCRALKFRGEFLLWPLFEGQMLTAAIMGVLPGFRYILITPALLESLSAEELDSVIAHEIGHVKYGHLLLYILLILGLSLLTAALMEPLPQFILASDAVIALLPHLPWAPDTFLALAATLPALVFLLLSFRFLFGYFIRNFERQADTYVFMAQGTGRYLISAFEKIASLSGTRPDEKNWHHFGIGERIAFLRRCEGERSLSGRHTRKVMMSLAAYVFGVGLLLAGLGQIDMDALAKANEARYVEAVLERKIHQETKDSLPLIMLGELLQHKKMEHRAVEAYEKALRLEPTGDAASKVNNNLAWLLLTARDRSLRDPHRALALAEIAVVLKPCATYLDTLATAYWANGRIEEALVTEFKALRLDPDRRSYYQNQMSTFLHQSWGGEGDVAEPPPGEGDR